MWSLQLAVKPPGHNLIHVDKWFLKMYHTCVFAVLAIYGHSDHETNITIEFTLKNGSWKCITLVFARLATYGHSDHKTNITVEFTSKNGSQKCIFFFFFWVSFTTSWWTKLIRGRYDASIGGKAGNLLVKSKAYHRGNQFSDDCFRRQCGITLFFLASRGLVRYGQNLQMLRDSDVHQNPGR